MLLGVGSAESVRRGPRYLPLRIRHGMRGEVLTLPKRGSGFVHGSRDAPLPRLPPKQEEEGKQAPGQRESLSAAPSVRG